MIPMKIAMLSLSFLLIGAAALADSPDESFLKNAAEGGISEVELGQLAQQKASNPAVKNFGAMMVKDHTAANDKLETLAASEQVSLPDSPSLMQKASKTKLSMLSGDSFDKSYRGSRRRHRRVPEGDFERERSSSKGVRFGNASHAEDALPEDPVHRSIRRHQRLRPPS
jgi:putative membrane protein